MTINDVLRLIKGGFLKPGEIEPCILISLINSVFLQSSSSRSCFAAISWSEKLNMLFPFSLRRFLPYISTPYLIGISRHVDPSRAVGPLFPDFYDCRTDFGEDLSGRACLSAWSQMPTSTDHIIFSREASTVSWIVQVPKVYACDVPRKFSRPPVDQ